MSALRKSTKSALSSLKAKVEEEENNPVVALQSFQIDFDWAIFDEERSVGVLQFEKGKAIVHEDVCNDSVFRLLEGEVSLELGGKDLGVVIKHTDEWPVFCEISALVISGKGRTSCGIVARTLCKLQVIPSALFLSTLFSESRNGFGNARLLFEGLCRHYANKLVNFRENKDEKHEDGKEGGGGKRDLIMSGCLSINGEFSFLNVPCSFNPNDVDRGEGREEEDEIIGVPFAPSSPNPSSLASSSPSLSVASSCPSKFTKLRFDEEEWGHPPTPPAGSSSPRSPPKNLYLCASLRHIALVDDAGVALKVFQIQEIHSLNVKKSKFTVIMLSGEKLECYLAKDDAVLFKQTLLALYHPQRGGGGWERRGERVGKTASGNLRKGYRGLGEREMRGLMKKGRVVKYKSGQTILTKGVRTIDLLYVLKGSVLVDLGSKVAEIESHQWLGELGFILRHPPSADVFAGKSGCVLLHISFPILYQLGTNDPLFLCYLYQTLLSHIWSRMSKREKDLVETKKKKKLKITLSDMSEDNEGEGKGRGKKEEEGEEGTQYMRARSKSEDMAVKIGSDEEEGKRSGKPRRKKSKHKKDTEEEEEVKGEKENLEEQKMTSPTSPLTRSLADLSSSQMLKLKNKPKRRGTVPPGKPKGMPEGIPYQIQPDSARRAEQNKVLRSQVGPCGFLQYMEEPQFAKRKKRGFPILDRKSHRSSSDKHGESRLYMADLKSVQEAYAFFVSGLRFRDDFMSYLFTLPKQHQQLFLPEKNQFASLEVIRIAVVQLARAYFSGKSLSPGGTELILCFLLNVRCPNNNLSSGKSESNLGSPTSRLSSLGGIPVLDGGEKREKVEKRESGEKREREKENGESFEKTEMWERRDSGEGKEGKHKKEGSGSPSSPAGEFCDFSSSSESISSPIDMLDTDEFFGDDPTVWSSPKNLHSLRGVGGDVLIGEGGVMVEEKGLWGSVGVETKGLGFDDDLDLILNNARMDLNPDEGMNKGVDELLGDSSDKKTAGKFKKNLRKSFVGFTEKKKSTPSFSNLVASTSPSALRKKPSNKSPPMATSQLTLHPPTHPHRAETFSDFSSLIDSSLSPSSRNPSTPPPNTSLTPPGTVSGMSSPSFPSSTSELRSPLASSLNPSQKTPKSRKKKDKEKKKTQKGGSGQSHSAEVPTIDYFSPFAELEEENFPLSIPSTPSSSGFSSSDPPPLANETITTPSTPPVAGKRRSIKEMRREKLEKEKIMKEMRKESEESEEREKEEKEKAEKEKAEKEKAEKEKAEKEKAEKEKAEKEKAEKEKEEKEKADKEKEEKEKIEKVSSVESRVEKKHLLGACECGCGGKGVKPGMRIVDFKHAKITRLLAPTGGSGASVFTTDVGGMSCVMKEIHVGGHLSKEAMNKFSGEIELIEKLSHPNIVQYLHHEYKRASIRLFLTRYESSLRTVIQERALDVQGDLEDPFSSREILTILGDVARGLMYLHSHHVIHRDLKSDNIFVCFTQRQNISKAVIGDFDTAKSLTLADSVAKTITGTTNYIAPEVMQIVVNPLIPVSYSFKADIWSFSMVCYELLTLQLPYGNLHMNDAIARIQRGQRPPVPPSEGGLPDPDSMELYRPVIEIFEACSAPKPDIRPSADMVGKMIEDRLGTIF